jgi:hypothetical protein
MQKIINRTSHASRCIFLFVKVISLIDLIWLLSFPSSTFELNAPQLTIVQPFSIFWIFISLSIVNHINKYIQNTSKVTQLFIVSIIIPDMLLQQVRFHIERFLSSKRLSHTCYYSTSWWQIKKSRNSNFRGKQLWLTIVAFLSILWKREETFAYTHFYLILVIKNCFSSSVSWNIPIKDLWVFYDPPAPPPGPPPHKLGSKSGGKLWVSRNVQTWSQEN